MQIPIDRRCLKLFPIVFIIGMVLILFSLKLAPFVLIIWLSHFAFFRDPKRNIPTGENAVSPADGKVVEISTYFDNQYFKEEVLKIGIFLSVFNVHINRAPVPGTIDCIQYAPGKFLNALDSASAKENESNFIAIKNDRFSVAIKQIAGTIARRICCDVKTGQTVDKGAKLGMICYGSRTEFYIPKRFFVPSVQIGQKVKAGETILGELR